MFWQEDDDNNDAEQLTEDVQDLLFSIECKTLPLDHGFVLSQQIQQHIPWIADEPLAAIHQIHVAESANGWMRPDDPDQDVLCVSRRTKMTIRLPKSRHEDVQHLIGKTLDIQGHILKVGDFRTRKLSRLTTLFARYVDTDGTEDETIFLNNMAQKLREMGIQIKKMMSGRLLTHETPDGIVLTRKLMVSDLDVAQSLMLQEQGIGDKQLMGLGIFIPHKGIDAVNKKQDK
jgi:CRISPR-associated protein Cas6